MDDHARDIRREELTAILQARPVDAVTLERMVYGPQPLTDDTRAVIAEWCEP